MAGTQPITTSIAHHGEIVVLAVSGEIDVLTGPRLQSAIDEVLAQPLAALIIDLSAVEFLASVGLRILVDTHQRLADSAYFVVVADGSATSRPIHLMNLDEVFELYPTVEEALAAARSQDTSIAAIHRRAPRRRNGN